ncbi:MAG: small basic protein [Planctomycetota bacterium]
MSIHKSLRSAGKLVRTRNVYTRAERLEILERDRLWKEGDKVLGFPKTKVVKIKKGGKKKKKEEKKEGEE